MARSSGPDELRLTPWQASGANRAGRILDRTGMVLVADATGLGKTFIGIELIRRGLASGHRVVVTAPAALRPHWRGHLHSAGLAMSDLEARTADPASIAWISHTALAHRRPALQPDLVVVDEAHAFRNPTTRRYRGLAFLCRAAQLVLMTATPINNSLMDLYFQMRIGIADNALARAGVPDLAHAFRVAARDGSVDQPLRRAIATVTVRRSRAAVMRRRINDPRFPIREVPKCVRWASPDVMPAIVGLLADLEFAAFATRSADSTPELIRFGLLKRLESSFEAFRRSLRSLGRFLDAFVEAAAAGLHYRPRDRIGTETGQLLLGPVALDPWPPNLGRRRLIEAATSDRIRVDTLLDLSAPPHDADAKSGALLDLIDGPLQGRKVIVFTEFRDTARYLWRTIARRHRCALIDGSAAWLGGQRAGRAHVIHCFAPSANRAPAPPPAERIDVLIATDVLAEGFNLQDAADVVSFDLPWNPVRLLQRLGRVDRLGSPHDSVRCWNFLPDRHLDQMLGLLRRLESKLTLIRAGIGRPARVLSHTVDGRHGVSAGPGIDSVVGAVRSLERPRPGLLDAFERGFWPILQSSGPLQTKVRQTHTPTMRSPRRIAERLLRLLAAVPGGADPAICLRADRVLDRLAAGIRAGPAFDLDAADRSVRRGSDPAAELATLLAVIDSVL